MLNIHLPCCVTIFYPSPSAFIHSYFTLCPQALPRCTQDAIPNILGRTKSFDRRGSDRRASVRPRHPWLGRDCLRVRSARIRSTCYHSHLLDKKAKVYQEGTSDVLRKAEGRSRIKTQPYMNVILICVHTLIWKVDLWVSLWF